MNDPWKPHLEALGALIHQQRTLAGHSLRELASMTNLSSAYLSQLERGLHEPSARVVRSISEALEISTQNLLAQAGFVDAAGCRDDGPADGHRGGDRGRPAPDR